MPSSKETKLDLEFPHLNTALFQSAIEATTAATGFQPALIEKDYYCSIVLNTLYKSKNNSLVFKGGTALNKVHAGFYRLSEDLDFSIPMSPESPRSARSSAAKPLKNFVDCIYKLIPGVAVRTPLTGSNNSTQYNAELEYRSLVAPMPGTIQFEIGLREELLLPPMQGIAQTLIQNPFTDEPLLAGIKVICISCEESYAEKTRAALSRRIPAIRDLFDLDYGIREKKFDPDSRSFHGLVRRKLEVSGSGSVNLSESRKKELRGQFELALRPVLREIDYNRFDFEAAWTNLIQIEKRLSE